MSEYTSIVVTKPSRTGDGIPKANRTFKVLQAIILKIPIVNFSWIRSCFEHDQLVDPSSFLIKSDTFSDRAISRRSLAVKIDLIN